jgi:zinc protease
MMNSACARLVALLAAALFCATSRGDGPLFDFQQVTLDNGLKVITLEDFSCPIVAVHLWYHVGSKDEDPQRQGFAHMFEHMMFRGTDRLGPTDHFDLIRRTGGECNAYTAWDQTVYVQTLPAEQLELALWLEAERMAFLKIDQTAFDTERKVVEEERRLNLNRPYGDVPEKVLAEAFKVHPYRWLPIGNIAHLRAATVQELRDFWTRFYVPSNATLVVVGAVKHDDAQRMARQAFGWIPSYPVPPRVSAVEPPLQEPKAITVKAESAPAPVVALAWRSVRQDHPDYPALQMAAAVLGGGQSSRLYRKIVAEDRSAVVALAGAFSLEQDGAVGAAAVLAPLGADATRVLATMQQEIERMRSELVSEDELQKARNQELSSIVGETLTVESKASALGRAAVLEGDTSRVNRRLDDVRAVTREDIQRVIRTYLAPERCMTVRVERNLLGMLLGRGKSEESAPVTAQREETAPPPGRSGLSRPADYPTTAPAVTLREHKVSPAVETGTLANGLKVIVVENHEVPFVSMQLGLKAGAYQESKPGTASMALGMLTRGTKTRSEADIARELETYAINLGGSAGMDGSAVSASCLTEHAERAVQMLAEVVRNPTFPDDEYQKYQQQVRTGLAISSVEPATIAERELRRQMYGEHPYSRSVSGEPADVDRLESDDLAPWWQRWARPDLATLIFAGDITPQRAMELAQRELGDWKADGPTPPLERRPLPPGGPRRIVLVNQPGVQCQIRVGGIGITREHPDWFTARVVSDYFGGAFSSRLNESIRVKKGLTYGARGGFSSQKLAGQFAISTFSKVESTGQAVQAILDELARLQAEPPTDVELASVRSYTIGNFPSDRETPQQMAQALWTIELNELPADYFEKMISGVARASREDCTRLVTQNLDPQKLAIVVVGPAEQLKAELEKIAPVTVVGSKGETEDE